MHWNVKGICFATNIYIIRGLFQHSFKYIIVVACDAAICILMRLTCLLWMMLYHWTPCTHYRSSSHYFCLVRRQAM